MKLPVLCLAVLSSTLAVPNGYYHQEYNYKTSSSSFKNNELQHKTDDQGYYKKDGDLEGQTKPRVDSNSEHSEYVNPNLRNSQYGSQYTSGYTGDSDLSSLGVMRATNDYSGYDANGLAVDGLAQNDRIVGSRGYSSGYSSGYGSNNYGSSSSSSAANLRVITSHLQQDLENDLREAIRFNNLYAQSRVDLTHLESELRRNLTERLNNELIARYGQQMIRNGMSYSLDGGRLHSTANYNNQELDDLKNQVENTLLNQLKTQYHSSSSSSNQYYSQHNQQGSYGYSTTARPLYRPIYPTLPTTARYPIDYNTNSNYNTHANYQAINSNYQTVNANTRYTPVQHPESITSIASKVQTEMDQQLNQLLDETKTKYFSSSSAYSLTNTNVLLERLRNELRNNLTYLLDENVRRNYGTQQQKDGYMYSLGPSGQFSSEYNYALRDLENLKAQVETNLINKLNKDIEGYKTSWSTHQSYSSQSNYGNSYDYSSTPRYDYYSNPNYGVYTTPRSSIYSLYTTPSAHGAGYIKNGGYNYVDGSQSSGYEVQSSGNMAQLQRNLQDQLSRQLQAAINQEQSSSTYSSSGSGYSPSNYQSSLQELSNELNRNLTRNLQEYSASGSYAAYGNFDSAQMERLKTQLQESLMTQLRQGLQRSFQSHGTFSSSGNSNYRQVRGFQNQQQYRFEHESKAGEDCDGQHSYRAKRSYSLSGREANSEIGQQVELGQLQELESPDLVQEVQSPLEFGQQEEDDYGELVSSNQIQLGQQIDDFSSNQQAENVGYGRLSVHNPNQRPMEAGQQVEDEYTGIGKLVLPNQEPIEQQTYNSELSQQVVDSGYGRLESQSRRPIEVGQQVEDEYTGNGKLVLPNQEPIEQQTYNSDLSQQVVDSGYRRLESQSRRPIEVGQQVEDEYTGNGKLVLPNQEPIEQQTYNSDLSQQVVDSGYRRLESQSRRPIEVGQQVEDEYTGNGKLVLPNQEPIEQQTYNSDLSQQVVDSGYRRLESQSRRPIEVGQQVEDEYTGNGKLVLPNQEPIEQQTYNSDLSQQVVDSGYGRLESQSQRPVEVGQQVEDEYTGNGKFVLPNQEPIEQRTYNTDLHQQVADSGQRLQSQSQDQSLLDNGQRLSNQEQLGQQIDDQLHQLSENEPTGYGRLQFSNQEPLAQQIDYTKLTQHPMEIGQQVEDEDINYGQKIELETQQIEDIVEPHAQHPLQLGQKVDEYDTGYGKLQILDQKPLEQQEESGYTGLRAQHQTPMELGEQVDKGISHSTQQMPNQNSLKQMIDYDGQVEEVVNPVEFGHVINEESNSEISGQKIEQSIQPVVDDNKRPLELGQVVKKDDTGYGKIQITDQEPLGQQTNDQELNQQLEESHTPSKISQHIFDSDSQIQQVDKQTTEHEHEQVSYSDNLVEPLPHVNQHEPSTQNQIIQSHEDFSEWCDKFVDTSLMDAPWFLGRELKENITKVVFQNGGNEADSSNVLKEVLRGIPKEMLTQCFEIEKIELKYQKTVLAGLEEYFQTLLRKDVDDAIKGNSERNDPISVDLNSEPVHNQQQIVQSQESGSSPNHNKFTLIQGPPKSPTEPSIDFDNWCSQYVDLSVMNTAWSISKNLKNNIVEKVCEDSNPETTYNKVLADIPNDMLRKCFQIDTMKPNEQELVLEGIEDYFQSLIRREIESAIKSYKNQPTVEDLDQLVDITANYPSNEQRTNQNQFAPQTIDEAEQVGDALIVALRKKTQSRPPVSQESPGHSKYATPQSNPYGSSNPQVGNLEPNPMVHRQYGYNRDLYAPYGHRHSHDLENFEGNHQYTQSHQSRRYPSFNSYGNHHQRLDNPYPSIPGTYGSYNHQIPQRRVVEQNMESGSLNGGDPHLESYELYHRHHQRHRHYGHHVESSSNIEQLNGGNSDNITPVKVHHRPVYSGIKGRRIVHPMTQEPLQKPIQVPVQIPVHEPVQESVQEPISPVSVAPSSSDNFERRPEKIIASEQVESQSPEELSWWQKFGNKVKQGAQSLKQKIVG